MGVQKRLVRRWVAACPETLILLRNHSDRPEIACPRQFATEETTATETVVLFVFGSEPNVVPTSRPKDD